MLKETEYIKKEEETKVGTHKIHLMAWDFVRYSDK